MFTKGELKIFHTAVEPKNSGSRIFTKADGIVDINDLHRALLDNNAFVVLRNNVGAWTDATKEQIFIVTDVLHAEDGYVDTFTFSHFGRSLGSSATNRKIVMSFSDFSDNPTLKATYYTT